MQVSNRSKYSARTWITAGIMLLALLVQVSCSGSEQHLPRSPVPGAALLKVVSYNVNYGVPPLAEAVELLRREQADLVLLQESTPAWERAWRGQLSAEYPHRRFHHAQAAGGIGFFSRHPVQESEVIPPPAGGWFSAQRLVVQLPGGPLQVLNVHLHPPVSEQGSVVSGYFTTGPVRARELEHHLARLAPGLPTLVAGDFNEKDGDALEVLEQHGLRSALQEVRPGQHTWRWPTALGEIRAQLDHIAYRPPLALLDARVVPAGASDHLPLVCEFQIVGPVPRVP